MAIIAALLGIIGGLVGLVTGVGLDNVAAGPQAIIMTFHDLTAVHLAQIVVPLAGIVGGFVARKLALISGVLMILAAAGMAIIFPIDYPMELAIACCTIGGMMAILAGSKHPAPVPSAG